MRERVLVNELYPYVEKAFSDKNNVKKLSSIISKYIDRNSEALSSIGPTKQILFTDMDRDPIYKMVGITPKMERDIKKKSKDIVSTGKIVGRPFSTLMVMIIRYFSLTKNEKMLPAVVFYFGMSTYHNKYSKYFKFPPNEEVMAYTVSNMSNKYKIKQKGNLADALDETYYNAFLNHRKNIDHGDDKEIVDYILASDARVNSFLKKICNEFMRNHKEGNYIVYDLDDNDPENFKQPISTSHTVSVLTDKITMKLITEGPPVKLLATAAKANKISHNELKNYVTLMATSENKKDIHDLVESILLLYLFDKKNKIEDINSMKFMSYCMDVYKRSKMTNPNIIKIKKILDNQLTRLDIYRKTQRQATIADFRRALFMFFVLCISYYNAR